MGLTLAGETTDPADLPTQNRRLQQQVPQQQQQIDELRQRLELLEQNPAAARRILFMTGDVITENFQEFLKQHNRICPPKPFALREFHAALASLVNTG